MSKFKITQGLVILAIIVSCGQAAVGAAVSYTYDNLNQLTKVVYVDSTVEEFSYDPAGNRNGGILP